MATTKFTGLENDELPPPPTLMAKVMAFVRKQPLGTAGLVLVLIFILMAALADFITVHNPESGEFFDQFVRPFSTSDMTDNYYLLGTDEFGRDVFTRIV